jgi:hypothetical protein
MDHYILNCHGLNLTSQLFKVPDDTYIITVTDTGVTLKELWYKFEERSHHILGGFFNGPTKELFEHGNTTKEKTEEGKRIERLLRHQADAFIIDGRVVEPEELGDPNINVRNHLPGDVLPDIRLSTREPDPFQRKFLGVWSRKGNEKPIIDNSDMDTTLSNFIHGKKGVFILFVCRSDETYAFHYYLSDKKIKFYVDEYLQSRKPGHWSHILSGDYLMEIPPYIRDLVKFLGDKGIYTTDEAVAYLKDTPPPPLALSRAHSQTTDTNEPEVQNMQQYHEKRPSIPDIISELKQDLVRLDVLKLKTNDRSKEKEIEEAMDEIDRTIKSISSEPLPEFSVPLIQALERKIHELADETPEEKETKLEMLKTLTVLHSFRSPTPSASSLRYGTHRRNFMEDLDGGKKKRKRRKTKRRFKN